MRLSYMFRSVLHSAIFREASPCPEAKIETHTVQCAVKSFELSAKWDAFISRLLTTQGVLWKKK